MLKQKKKDYPLDLNKKLNIAHINLCTEAEGPYKRMAIWFQGCNIRCEGCCNPELQDFKIANIITIRDVLEIIDDSCKKNGIEGITFLGGEPTLQDNLLDLILNIRKRDLGIILFSGEKIEKIDKEIVNNVDILIDGKYDKLSIDKTRNLVGSVNQKIYYISNRYKDQVDWFEKTRDLKVEINLGDSLFISGDVI